MVPSPYEQLSDTFPTTQYDLSIVSTCPDCGNPIYGKERIAVGEVPIVVKSCHCDENLNDEMED